ncbi:outer membrane protein [Spirochaetia bacterium]|nr:outer membrane protein [Spirochaetia bacterium]
MMKKHGITVFIFTAVMVLSLAVPLEAQQLTRFAVVDLNKVYTQFFRESRAVREWEERSAKVQSEVDRMSAEIQTLQSSFADAGARGDEDRALRIQNDIYRKQDFLREYYQAKKTELEEQMKKLSQSGSFLEQVRDEIRFIAESEGYSMVLNQRANTGILWFSPTVDITEKLITNLRTKSGR